MGKRDTIKASFSSVKKVARGALDKAKENERTIYELRKYVERQERQSSKDYEELKYRSSRINSLEKANEKLREKLEWFQDLFTLIETLFPDVMKKAKDILQSRKDKEYQQQLEQENSRKKKSWDMSL